MKKHIKKIGTMLQKLEPSNKVNLSNDIGVLEGLGFTDADAKVMVSVTDILKEEAGSFTEVLLTLQEVEANFKIHPSVKSFMIFLFGVMSGINHEESEPRPATPKIPTTRWQ